MLEPFSPQPSEVQCLPFQLTCISVPTQSPNRTTEPLVHRSSAIVLTALLGGRSASLPTLFTLSALVSGLALALPGSSSVLVLLSRPAPARSLAFSPLTLRTPAVGLACAPGSMAMAMPAAAPPRTGDAGNAGVGVKCMNSAKLNLDVPGVMGKSNPPGPEPPGVLRSGSLRTGGGSSVSPEIELWRSGEGRSIDTEEDAMLPPLPLVFDDVLESWNSTRAAAGSPTGLRV